MSPHVRDELYARGVTDEQIDTFRIGYLNRNLPELAGADDFLRWSHQGQRLDDVFVFPLTNPLNTVCGFQFRHVQRDRKGYLDYIPYKEEPVLFGLGQAAPHVWATDSVWLVEGVFDLLPLQRHVPNIVATLTAKVPASLMPFLRRLVRRVWVGYDSDAAGQSAARQFTREFGREFDIRSVYYPKVPGLDGVSRTVKDPGELWEAWGDEQVGSFLQTVLRSVPDGVFDGKDIQRS